jgi:hypothetical protein
VGEVTMTRRKAVWRDRVRAYTVLIDGQRVGKLGSGESATFPLAPGPHEVRLKLDWCGSPKIICDGNENTRLVCDAGGTSATAIIDVLFRSQRYIALERL